MIFGWGNGGWGGFGGRNGGDNGANTFLPYAVGANGALTRGELCQDMNFQEVQNGVRGIQQGLCDGFYSINSTLMNGFHGVDNAVCTLGYQTQQGFNGVDNAICNLGYQVQSGFNANQVAMMQGQNAIQTQLAQCCCDNRSGQKDIQYQLATDACAIQTSIANSARDIIDNQNCNYRGLMDFMVQSKIDSLQAENSALRLNVSQSQQNAAIGAMITASEANILRRTGSDCPIPAYVVPNPNCCYGPFGYNGYNGFNGYNNSNNCGCGCGCN